jgi:hypothetical protein
MPVFLPFLIQIAVMVAMTVAMRILSSLLAPQQASFGGNLQSAREPGTQVTVRNPDQPHQIVFGERRVQGNVVFAHCTENNSLLHLVIEWAGHECASLGALYFNDELVQSGAGQPAVGAKYRGYTSTVDHLGASDQLADANLIAYAPDKWTVEHRGRGICYSYINLRWNRDLFPQGLPNIWRVVKGYKVYDPRSLTTVWSDNAALCAAAWLANAKFGRGIAYGGASGIDTAALAAAANVCDETVALKSGGTEKAYTANGVLQSDQPFIDNLEKLLSAMRGTAALIGGEWVIDAAAWEEPTLVLDEGDFRAAFTVTTGIGNAEAFNAIKGKFANPAKLWQPDDFPAITSSVYEIEDGGDGAGSAASSRTSTSNSPTRPAMAQRIARIDLRAARQPISFTAQVKLKGLQLRAGNTVAIDNTMLGWAEKPFRVEKLRLVLGFAPSSGSGSSAQGSQQGIIGVDLELRETAEAIYDWDPAIDEQAHDPAPNTTLPDLFNPGPPGAIEVTEELYATRDGAGVKTRAILEWTASADAFVDHYRPQYRPAGGTWRILPAVESLTTTIEDLAPGSWEFGVASVNRARIVSAATSRTVTLTGLLAPPSAPSTLTGVAIGGLAILRIAPTGDLDVRIGGKSVWRHSPALSGATWDTATPIGDELPGGDTVAVLPLKAGTYLAKFKDSSGLFSAAAASVVLEQAALRGFTTPAGGSLVEDPTFTGSKTHCAVSASKLKLTAGQATGSYAFSSTMDLGSVKRVRVTTDLAVQVVNNTDTWDSSELCDSTDLWDGAVTGNEADAIVWVRKTNDDPAGAPTWGEWNRLDSAEYAGRGFQFRLDLRAYDTNYGIEISELAVVAEEAT